MKRVFPGLLLFLFFKTGFAEPGPQINKTPTAAVQGKSSSHAGLRNTSLVNVLFATNEDCDLYINDELKGSVLRTEFLYLNLSPGKYSYRARSKTTLDEFRDSFTVRDGAINEIFIDLLYVIDEKNAERDAAKNKAQGINQQVLFTGSDQQTNRLATTKDAELSIINSLTGNMVRIRGGSFVMGNNKSPFKDEAEHPVTVNGFLFSRYEVTQHQWETIMGYNPSFNVNCPTCPVENISWEEAMRFIRKLNVLSNKKFRLPTEAEWEYVAKIGGKTEIDTAGGPEEYIRKTAWFFSNADKRTHPVGLRQANVAGIFDLTGNVSEWCADWYGVNYNREDFEQLNPEGPPLGKEKIIRGGNYKDYSGDRFRPSLRNKRSPVEKSSEIGFRLAMDLN